MSSTIHTQEISFSELREAYTQVREFVKEKTGCEDKGVGLYSTIEEDFGLEDLDYDSFEREFFAKFNISIANYKKEEVKGSIWGNIAMVLLFILLLIPSIILLILFGIVMLLKSIFPKYFPETEEEIQLPSKKDWQQDKLTVADLVSTLIAKEYMPKKNVNYVLKKCE